MMGHHLGHYIIGNYLGSVQSRYCIRFVRIADLTTLTNHLNMLLHTRAFRQLIVSLIQGVRISYVNTSTTGDEEVRSSSYR